MTQTQKSHSHTRTVQQPPKKGNLSRSAVKSAVKSVISRHKKK